MSIGKIKQSGTGKELLKASMMLPFSLTSDPSNSCRSDPEDDLENAEFLGVNSYLHCDGSLSDTDALPGYEALLADFARYEVPVPVMVSLSTS